MDVAGFYEDNQANWDDRARVHVGSTMYDIEEYATNPNRVSDIVEYDLARMEPIAGRSVAHLQCHIGTDTISFERLGAGSVVGVDFSPVAIATARELAERAGVATKFVEANVYDAAEAIGHTVDLVYTSVGAICWLHDLDAWAAAIAGLLVPGGRFYLRDVHPFLFVFEEIDGRIVPTYDYSYSADAPLTLNDDDTYTDNPNNVTIASTTTHEWNHSIPEIYNALVGAGLRVDEMAEHTELQWQILPSCVAEGDLWFLPEPLRSQVPAMFSLQATKI